MANSETPEIIQGVIPPVHQESADGVSTCVGDLHAVRTVLSEDIVTGAAPSAARVLKYPLVVNWKAAISPIPIDMNTAVVTPKATNQVLIGTGTSGPSIRIRIQDISSPRGSIGPQKVRNDHTFKTSINIFLQNMGTLRPFSVRQ